MFRLVLFRSKIQLRTQAIEKWSNDGGVLVIGYDMFRNLTLQRKKIEKMNKKSSEERKKEEELMRRLRRCLVVPGADLAVFDEGHLLQSPKAQNYKACDQISTHRRIILTGTPLQNNLIEYYWMISFIKLEVLGELKQFKKLFHFPITNGQKEHATKNDINFMKRRAYILQRLISPNLHRVTNALHVSLPAKREYLLRLQFTEIQLKLYKVLFV